MAEGTTHATGENVQHKLDLISFIEEVAMPLDSFSSICLACAREDNAPIRVETAIYDIGIVVGALNSLARFRMKTFGEQLQNLIGKVEIIQLNEQFPVQMIVKTLGNSNELG